MQKKKLDKTEYPCMTEILNQLGIEGSCPNITQPNKKPQLNLLYSESFFPKVRSKNKNAHSHHFHSTQYWKSFFFPPSFFFLLCLQHASSQARDRIRATAAAVPDPLTSWRQGSDLRPAEMALILLCHSRKPCPFSFLFFPC